MFNTNFKVLLSDEEKNQSVGMGLLGANFKFMCSGTSAVFGVFQLPVCWIKDLISVLVYLIKTKWSGQCPQHTVWEEHRIRIAITTAVISATG